jgi:hypothetical protein
MGLFGGDSDNSSKVKVDTTTNQVDRRAGASDRAQQATEGSTLTNTITNRTAINRTNNIKVASVDAKVIKAALAGSNSAISEALAFSEREAARGARTVEAALATTAGTSGLDTLARSGTTLAIAAVAGFILLMWFRR